MEPIVTARDLAVGYGTEPVCSPATFTLERGQALFLVGVNGAGKSTLLRTACGLLPPLGGQLTVLGHTPDPRSTAFRTAVARDLGDESFFPFLTVREHLELVQLGHGATADLEAVITGLGLSAIAQALPNRLSSGQRRRAVLASVLLRPRRLLVLDEPEQRLDHSTRVMLAGRLVAEREAGGTLLVVSHDPALVDAVATHVLLVGEDTRPLTVDEGVEAIEEGAL
ncbi:MULTISPECIES: ABC transporter ATP-binding protein [Actinomyces]|nr:MULTISPECIES: ATP-binding cassette domain-containing protein [Actinomyces]